MGFEHDQRFGGSPNLGRVRRPILIGQFSGRDVEQKVARIGQEALGRGLDLKVQESLPGRSQGRMGGLEGRFSVSGFHATFSCLLAELVHVAGVEAAVRPGVVWVGFGGVVIEFVSHGVASSEIRGMHEQCG